MTRADRPYDPADISSLEFWSGTAKDREKVFAELRANRPISWHRPVKNGMFEDPNDQGFWAVVRHADLVEVTRRPGDFLSGKGITFESLPVEVLDAAQGFIAMDPPRHTKIRRLLASAFTPKQLARIDDHIVDNARRIVDGAIKKGADKGRIDFVTEVAALVPMHNICDMVGIPEEHRRTIAYESQFADGWRDPRLLQGVDPLTRVFQTVTTIQQARRRPDDRTGAGRGGRRTTHQRRDLVVLRAADHRRQRHHPAVHRPRDEGAHRLPRSARLAAGGPRRPDALSGRRDHPVGHPHHDVPAYRRP
jgi:cytochrome P450